MSLERTYSKAKGNANHVVWTPNEILQVPFTLDGLVFDGADFGHLRVVGRDMMMVGFRVDFRVPSRSNSTVLAVAFHTGNNIPVTGGRLVLSGVIGSDTILLSPNYPLPANSLWKFTTEVEYGDITTLPQGLTVTYLMRYANGPIVNAEAVYDLQESGIGYWKVGSTFSVS